MKAEDERVLVALADPTRRELVERLGRLHRCSATTLARGAPVTRQAVLKHLAVLADAGLVESARQGREMLFEVRPEPLLRTADWLTDLAHAWDARLADLKQRAEHPTA